ncbi:MAG: hypothetical protein FH748_10680 [Balneolaceae bacterium]|nr:hypothetical protein [Balneolaceae bacterium]
MNELSESNYRRICVINWMLTIPMMVLFAWPYYYAGMLAGLNFSLRYLGAAIFATPFMLTILHGHVTMALGSVHRYLYYEWLEDRPLTFGLFFHHMFVSTRFRLILLVISLLVLLAGYLVSVK